jgi:hypothetical protein
MTSRATKRACTRRGGAETTLDQPKTRCCGSRASRRSREGSRKQQDGEWSVVLGRRLSELLDGGQKLSGLPALHDGYADTDQRRGPRRVKARRLTSPLEHLGGDWNSVRCWHRLEAMLREWEERDNGRERLAVFTIPDWQGGEARHSLCRQVAADCCGTRGWCAAKVAISGKDEAIHGKKSNQLAPTTRAAAAALSSAPTRRPSSPPSARASSISASPTTGSPPASAAPATTSTSMTSPSGAASPPASGSTRSAATR